MKIEKSVEKTWFLYFPILSNLILKLLVCLSDTFGQLELFKCYIFQKSSLI